MHVSPGLCCVSKTGLNFGSASKILVLFPVADTQIDSCWNRLRSLVGPRDRLGHCDCMGFAWGGFKYEVQHDLTRRGTPRTGS